MIKIFRGQTKGFTLKLRGELTGDPVDLTGATEVIVSLPLQDPSGTFLTKSLSSTQVSLGTDLKLGLITVTPDLSAVETLTLNPLNALQKIIVQVQKGSDVKFYTAEVLQICDP